MNKFTTTRPLQKDEEIEGSFQNSISEGPSLTIIEEVVEDKSSIIIEIDKNLDTEKSLCIDEESDFPKQASSGGVRKYPKHSYSVLNQAPKNPLFLTQQFRSFAGGTPVLRKKDPKLGEGSNSLLNPIASKNDIINLSNVNKSEIELEKQLADNSADIEDLLADHHEKKNKFKEIDENIFCDSALNNQTQPEIALMNAISSLTEEQRYERAADFFKDAFNGRKIHYGFSSRRIQKIYKFQTNPLWGIITSFASWIFLFMTFFENSHSSNRPFDIYSTQYWVLFSLETLIILIFIIDGILEFIYRYNDPYRTHTSHFIKNCKTLTRYFIDINLIIDFVLFWSLYSSKISYFRYGRVLRSLRLIRESRELRRFFKSVTATLPYIIDMSILFILVALIFAIIGVKVFEDIRDDLDQDKINEDNNFNDIGHALSSLYILITFSNYPAVMSPYYQNSPYYFLYFFPYIAFALVFLVPIPVAVIFDAFRRYRSQILIRDRMREKEALFAVYYCLDSEELGFIQLEQWQRFMTVLYNDKENKTKVNNVFLHFDTLDNNQLNMFDFFDACDLVLFIRDFSLAFCCELKCWEVFRKFCNDKLKLKAIVTSTWFEIFIFILVLVNVVVLIMYAATTDEDTIETLDLIDRILLYIFLLEVILKIIALGIIPYFSDNWNKFDFSLVMVSLFLDFSINIFQILKTAKGAKAAKSAKLAKSQRSLKILKGMRSFKAGRILSAGASTFIRLKDMIRKIILCFPSVKKLITLLFMLFYIFSTIGMECFPEFGEKTNYSQNYSFFGDFHTFGESMVLLFQILTQSGWHCSMFHYALNFNYSGCMIYFCIFHMLTVFIMFSIITGLVWEIFNMLDTKSKSTKEDLKEDQTAKSSQKLDVITEKANTYKRQKSLAVIKANVAHQAEISDISMSSHSFESNQNNISSPSFGVSDEEKESEMKDLETKNEKEEELEKHKKDIEEDKDEKLGKKRKDHGKKFRRGGFISESDIALRRTSTVNTRDGNTMFSLKSILARNTESVKLGEKEEPEEQIDFMKHIKSQYILRQALLKDASKMQLKKLENKYLDGNFLAYHTMMDKVLSKWDNVTLKNSQRDAKEGNIILLALRLLKNINNDKELIEKLNTIFHACMKTSPIGTFLHIIFESEDGSKSFLPIDEDLGIDIQINDMIDYLNVYSATINDFATIEIKEFNAEKTGEKTNKTDFSKFLDVLNQFATIQELGNVNLDEYYKFNWNLIVTRFRISSDELKFQELKSIFSVRQHNNFIGQKVSKSKITKGYIIALIPQVKQTEAIVMQQQHERMHASKIREITGKKKIVMSENLYINEMYGFMEDLGLIFEYTKIPIFSHINAFIKNATFQNNT